MNQIQAERLLTLSQYLRTMGCDINGRNDGFSITYWASHSTGKPEVDLTPEQQHNCGTTACAVGWACSNSTFNKMGLRWSPVNNEPKYRGLTGWDAVTAFFGLSQDEAAELFLSRGYPRQLHNPAPAHVADHIDATVKKHGWVFDKFVG